MVDGIEKILQSLEKSLRDRTENRLWAVGCATYVQLSAEKALGHIREQLHEKKYADDVLHTSF